MDQIYDRPLISNYTPTNRSVSGDVIFRQTTSLIYRLQQNIQQYDSDPSGTLTRINSFGPLNSMCGTIELPVDHLTKGIVHDEYRKQLAQHPLIESHTIQLPALDYNHFVLDIDLKSTQNTNKDNIINTMGVGIDGIFYEDLANAAAPPPPKLRLSTVEYRQYLTGGGGRCSRCNEVIYGIIQYLTNTLNLATSQYPIYILGKGGTLSKGCHIEIPELILPYYDSSLLSESCRILFPMGIVDPTTNYSIMGSQKYTDVELLRTTNQIEMNGTYLPYAVFVGGRFFDIYSTDLPTSVCFSSLIEAFDRLNICKPISYKNIRCLFMFVYNNLELTNLRKRLANDDDENENKYYEYDEEDMENNDIGKDKSVAVGIFRKSINTSMRIVYKSLSLNEGSLSYWDKSCRNTNKMSWCDLLLSIEDEDDSVMYVNNIQNYIKYVEDIPFDSKSIGSICMSSKRINRIFTYPPHPNLIRGQIDVSIYTSMSSQFIIRIHPFTIEHIKRIVKIGNRQRNTVYYLLALMYLQMHHLREDLMDDNDDYLRFISNFIKRDDTLVNMIKILRRHHTGIDKGSTTTTRSIEWCIVSLLNLIITENVISIREAFKLFIPNLTDNDPRYKLVDCLEYGDLTIPSSAGPNGPKLPRILVIANILYEDNPHNLLALYRPVIWDKGTNQFRVWDNILRCWIIYHNRINISIMLPDVDYLGGLIHRIRRETEDVGKRRSNPVKDNDINNKDEPAPKRQTTIPSKNAIVNDLSNRIKMYWSMSNLIPDDLPDHLFNIGKNGYVLIGGSNPKTYEVYDILPLPMYKTMKGSDTDDYDWNQVKDLLLHLPVCPFFKRFQTLTMNILKCEETTLSSYRDTTTTNLKHLNQSLENRGLENQHTNIITVNDVVHYEMNSGGFNTDTDGKFTVPCNVAKKFEDKQRLLSMSHDTYHSDLSDRQWNKYVQSLVGYVKYYVLHEMINLPSCIQTVCDMSATTIIRKTLSVPTNELNITTLAEVLCENLRILRGDSNDIDEPLKPECNCCLTHTLLVLSQIFSYDLSSLRYFLFLVVKACTQQSDKCINVFLGNSNSGKTLLLQLLVSVLGSSANLISNITAHKGLQDRTHDLSRGGKGTRLWYMDEISGSQKFNTTFFKLITGRSRIWIRGNYQDGSMEELQPSLFIFGNSKPQFDQNCPALLKRVQSLTFRSRFDTDAPIHFRRCSFPQFPLMTDTSRKRKLVTGMVALILHAHCHSSSGSLYYLVPGISNSIPWIPIAMREATVINSPEFELIRQILDRLKITEDPYGYITSKRLTDLIHGLPNVLKGLDVNTSDAISFIENRYMMSQVETDNLALPLTHVVLSDDNKTWIIHGLKEIDRNINDKYMRARPLLYNTNLYIPPPINE